MNKTEKIWMNGEIIPFEDAKIHILSHAIHYGSSMFEGIRCYDTDKGSAILFLKEHVRRLFDSAKIYRVEMPYTQEEVEKAIAHLVIKNKHRSCYIRPIVYRGTGALGVNPTGASVEVAIATWEWGSYLGEDVLEKGVDVKFSTWQRQAPNTFPAGAKAGGNYLNSQLIKMEAVMDGYAEGIALDVFGYVSEGSGENIFVIRDGQIMTPVSSQSILPGITRGAVMTIAEDLDIPLKETMINREMLYVADEIFMTGTAAEITPVRSVDKYTVGDGKIGPITKKLQQSYFDVIKHGENSRGWLTFLSGASTNGTDGVLGSKITTNSAS